MKNKKKVYVVATIIATILLIHSCSGEHEKTKAIKRIDINTDYKERGNKKEIKTKIDNSAVKTINNKVLVDIPKKIKLNKKVVSEKRKTKENFYISPKKEAVKGNIKEPIQSEKMGEEIIVTEKKESNSTVEKIKENTILLFGNFNFFNRDHRAGYKKNKTIKPPEVPVKPIIIWEDGKDITGTSYTLTHDVATNTNDGLKTIGGEIINEATITVTGVNNYGMRVEKDGNGINNGIINGASGAKADNGTITNTGLISLLENVDTKIGMEATNAGTVTNEESGKIEINSNDGTWNYGFKVGKDSTGINKGQLTLNGNGSGKFGMEASDNGIITNEKTGKIEINSNDGIWNYGMSVKDNGIGTNKGTITLNGDGSGKYGMEALGDGIITNKETGKIEINSNGGIRNYGMSVKGNGIGTNKGTITLNGDGTASGMEALDSGTITNEKTIDINSNNGVGMSVSNEATAINEGTININGDYGIGIEVTKGATGINDDLGIINLNANNGIGIKVDGVGSSYVNNGEINIASGTTGNQRIVLSGGATFSNSGSIVADGEFNTNQMGNGQFIMSDGGTLEADKIKGNIYASGALAMGGYDDIYSTYKMLKTNNLEGDIISNSAMFDAHFTENKDENGFYDVVLDRKIFNTIVSNEKLGEILENNYKDNGNELKEDYYDALKLVSTEKGLDKAVEDSYGMSYYPTLAKQTFEIVKDSNQVIVDQVLNNTKVRKTGETIAIAGVNTTKLKNDSYSNVSGYDTDLYSVYLGAEKQLNKDTRIGGIITIGRANTDYKDVEGSRDDYYYQGNIYYTYENDERLKFTSMIYGGITDTSLERTLAFGSLNETMKDDINNYYIGLNNELSKKYYFNRNYLKPKFELNFTYMNQDDISESGDQGLKIDGVKSMSIETGLGLALGRDFYIDNGSKVNLEGSVTGYAELGNPYKDLDSTFETLSTDKVEIDGYNNDDFYGDIMLGGSYETKNSLKLFTKLGYRIGNDSDGFIGNIGMNYLF